MSEESEQERWGEAMWLVDPIDGTTNVAGGTPHFGISIALVRGNRPEIGVVFAPAKDQLFVAERGGGAFLNHKPIHVSNVAHLDHARVLLDKGNGAG